MSLVEVATLSTPEILALTHLSFTVISPYVYTTHSLTSKIDTKLKVKGKPSHHQIVLSVTITNTVSPFDVIVLPVTINPVSITKLKVLTIPVLGKGDFGSSPPLITKVEIIQSGQVPPVKLKSK